MANLAQVAGVDALSLANMIISSARNATAHKKNCEQLAEHVKIISNLLEKIKSTDLVNLPATKEPLDCLEEALRKAFDLVESCKEKSYLYMLAMGECRLSNIKEGWQAIQEDQRDYTLDEDDLEAQSEALQEEKEKLQIELQRSRTSKEPNQCRVIEHLIEVTENVVNDVLAKKVTKLVVNEPSYVVAGFITNARSSNGVLNPGDKCQSEWQVDLFDCCKEPCLTLKTCIYPCGIFSRIANVVSKGKTTRENAINDLMAYSIFCGCCCYTCCIRKQIRQLFDIEVARRER
uniref:MCAfunc domain-containing protein n=1 Tax=Salix viminalis TaxID=40686 RepID=A0A6N2KM98_SALVM